MPTLLFTNTFYICIKMHFKCLLLNWFLKEDLTDICYNNNIWKSVSDVWSTMCTVLLNKILSYSYLLPRHHSGHAAVVCFWCGLNYFIVIHIRFNFFRYVAFLSKKAKIAERRVELRHGRTQIRKMFVERSNIRYYRLKRMDGLRFQQIHIVATTKKS